MRGGQGITVNRGRHLEHTPEETLANDWVDLMRAWAAAPEKGQDPWRRNIEAEYLLRACNLAVLYGLKGGETEWRLA